MHGGNAMGFVHLLLWGFWILVIGFGVWILIALVRSAGKSRKAPKSAVEILDERYARGEISLQEYQRMRREIEGGAD